MPQARYEALDSRSGHYWVLVLPYDDEGPPGICQTVGGVLVSPFVRGELVRPPGRVRFRGRSMLGAPVPKTAPDLDDHFHLGEHDVVPSPGIDHGDVEPVSEPSAM